MKLFFFKLLFPSYYRIVSRLHPFFYEKKGLSREELLVLEGLNYILLPEFSTERDSKHFEERAWDLDKAKSFERAIEKRNSHVLFGLRNVLLENKEEIKEVLKKDCRIIYLVEGAVEEIRKEFGDLFFRLSADEGEYLFFSCSNL